MSIRSIHSKAFDFILLVIVTLVAAVVSFFLELSFLPSTLLFFGVPSIYLLLRVRRHMVKILLASAVLSLTWLLALALLAEVNSAWVVYDLVFSYRYAGIVPLDEIIWGFLYTLYIILFYEHFIDGVRMRKAFSFHGFLAFVGGVLMLLVCTYYTLTAPELLHVPYAYLVLCTFSLLSYIAALCVKPRLILHTLPALLYFSFVFFVHEVTALSLSQWHFPGHYIGMLTILNVSFPIEELIFFIILSGSVVAAYFELIFDNQKN